ncbi:hypothetical protein [Parasutterella muris]|uniref:Uncharacterized protein n=1 Tax=Parasutterella muris TaxID=2565572 RepID=A0A6L6YJE5_9BURK|nr:hypothetical protein [Parasutterella muris]MVX57504.1 hypothetical protein [Parasutterella muris]
MAKTENGKDQPILGIDEKVLQNKLALCGYAAVVYKESPIQADKDGVVSEKKSDPQRYRNRRYVSSS